MLSQLSLRSLVLAAFVSASVIACGDDDKSETNAPAPISATDEATTRHIDVIKQRIVASNAKDWNTWQSLHTDGATRTAPELPAPLVGSAAMRAGIEELFETFPDYHLELTDAFGTGDRLVVRIHTHATMLGPLQLSADTVAPPTGKTFDQDWVALVRFEGDKIASFDEFYDNYNTLVQLGLSGE